MFIFGDILYILIVKMVFFSMSKVNLGNLNSFLRKLFDYDLV